MRPAELGRLLRWPRHAGSCRHLTVDCETWAVTKISVCRKDPVTGDKRPQRRSGEVHVIMKSCFDSGKGLMVSFITSMKAGGAWENRA